MNDIVLQDSASLTTHGLCIHTFIRQADISVRGIVWDIYFCQKCLLHVRKERPCPLHLKEIS